MDRLPVVSAKAWLNGSVRYVAFSRQDWKGITKEIKTMSSLLPCFWPKIFAYHVRNVCNLLTSFSTLRISKMKNSFLRSSSCRRVRKRSTNSTYGISAIPKCTESLPCQRALPTTRREASSATRRTLAIDFDCLVGCCGVIDASSYSNIHLSLKQS